MAWSGGVTSLNKANKAQIAKDCSDPAAQRRDTNALWGSGPAALAAEAANTAVPIVFTMAADPVELGLAARPGANITGVTWTTEVGPKRIQLMHELLPAGKNDRNSRCHLLCGKWSGKSVRISPQSFLRKSARHEIKQANGSCGRLVCSVWGVTDDHFNGVQRASR
jgi:hypothetical protein